MKKIILVGIATMVTGAAFSQSIAPADSRTISISEAKANQQSGKETMINGKPYSQYKAEQDALRQKSAQQPVTNDMKLVAATPAAVKQQPVDNQPVQNSKPDNIETPKQPVVQNNSLTLANAEKETSKPEVPVQFRIKDPQAWNPAAATTKATTTPVFDPAQKPGAETNVSKPIMQPEKSDRNAAGSKVLIAENKVAPTTESKTSEKVVAPVVTAVKDNTETNDAKTVQAVPQAKGN